MPPLMHGTAPLTARLEPWMERLLADPMLCQELIEEHGSPLNLHDFAPMSRNIGELRQAAEEHGIDFQIYLARKANKTIGAIDQAAAEGCGVDVASFNELDQCLKRGIPAEMLIVTAAVKSPALLTLAVDNDVVLSLDNVDEALDLLDIAERSGRRVRVALRLASANPRIAPTRFGLHAARWLDFLDSADRTAGLEVCGIHFHLNGYSGEQRALALAESLRLIDVLRELGHAPQFVDMGGGIPMSYLDDAAQWAGFWEGLAALPAGDESLTWKSDRLGAMGAEPSGSVYPYHQKLIRGEWLTQVLASHPEGGNESVAQMLKERGIQLRCEPGRTLLDGCGMTLAQVAFVKTRSDGLPLVGLHMNRTQCRSTSADFLVDPLLLHTGTPRGERAALSAFLVGAYCIEEELILRRRFEFPQGVAAGDLVAFPNTGGYLMHIIESGSHQLPLARNLCWDAGEWVQDLGDRQSTTMLSR
ncbi:MULTISPECIES: Y4yA family PLP-dependent enzyme [unclassified Arthrobacter]|uniref:Y4yA family PLP-dependent enzyme n=1 Tax=unclassified Arthrobacter TaxID=235627 RepID=UPI001C61613D|nr:MULTISPECIES: Y4yA family PLP-dependent enzyme [unclassified Arthrobacter]